jgi:hypothetical protein
MERVGEGRGAAIHIHSFIHSFIHLSRAEPSAEAASHNKKTEKNYIRKKPKCYDYAYVTNKVL